MTILDDLVVLASGAVSGVVGVFMRRELQAVRRLVSATEAHLVSLVDGHATLHDKHDALAAEVTKSVHRRTYGPHGPVK